MKEGRLKQLVRKLCFPPGSVRRVRIGPLRGSIFKVSNVTGLSPWYSGVERDHQRAFEGIVRAGDVVVDVGANWGVHTLYLSRLVGRNGLVFALEPFPQAFSELEWHVRANSCFNVKAVQVAASDNVGESLFNIGESPSEGGLSDVSVTTTREGQIKVATRTLDSLVDEWDLKNLRLVKIDVEGAESVVLSGARRVAESYRPHFIVDLHSPEQDVSVARLLASWGYTLSRLSGPPILRTDTGWPDINGVWGTILATHKA